MAEQTEQVAVTEPNTSETSNSKNEPQVETNETELPEFGETEVTKLLDDSDEYDEEDVVKPQVDEGKVKEDAKGEETPEVKSEAEVKTPEGEAPIAEATPKEEPKPEPTPELKPEQTPTETPPEPEPVAVEPALTTEEREAAYKTWRDGVENELATGRYAVTTEEAEEYDMSPEMATAYSKGMAKVYTDAITGAIGHMTNAMPQLLEAALASRDTTAVAEQEFYTMWPKLKSPEHGEVIQRLGSLYRAANPTVSKEDFIRDVGAQAHIALRIPVEAQAVSVVAPEEPASIAPFKPAGAGAPSGGPEAPKNIFTQLSADFDSEEEADFD